MKLSLSPALVKQSLGAHSVIGLAVGALMYLLCLTGTVAVLAFEFERWEQPGVEEFRDYDAITIERALAGFQQRVAKPDESIYVVLPTDELPRIHVADENREWWVNADGSLGPEVHHPFTEMLRALHYHLHLPETAGFLLVGGLGVALLALILSGILAHPRLFKDAFLLRLGGNKRLEQADIHNRLSVWGLPFHLMIAFTGALFGLLGPVAVVAAMAFFDNDAEAVFDEVYGADPVLEAPLQPLGIAAALDHMRNEYPEAQPIYFVAHKVGTPGQFMEIAATLPGRLVYSELYRFAGDGSLINTQGLSDGPAGRQFLYSIYRIHFGQFGGFGVKLAYIVLGLALTVVSATGVNIWLAKRGGRDAINALWCATVWGAPLAMAAAAVWSVLGGEAPIWIFLLTWLASAGLCIKLADEQRSRKLLRIACGVCLLALVGSYAVRAGFNGNLAALGINSGLILCALACMLLVLNRKKCSTRLS